MKMAQTECSEMLTHNIQTLGNHPKETIQHSEHSESLKARIVHSSLPITNTVLSWQLIISLNNTLKKPNGKFVM